MKRAILLGDNISQGTIRTVLKSLGYEYTHKILNSKVNNWKIICDLINENKKEEDELIILGKFTEYELFLLSLDEYKDVSVKLLDLILKNKHVIFIYHNNFFGEFTCRKNPKANIFDTINNVESIPSIERWMKKHNVEGNSMIYLNKIRDIVQKLNGDGYNILPYRTLADVEISGQKFIENTSQGLILKLYIPNHQIWSKELDKFILLFRDFTSTIIEEEMNISQTRTDRGVTFSIFSNSQELTENNISEAFNDFSVFLDICGSNPEEAKNILNKKGISTEKIHFLIAKYSKEAKRLMIDLKHEKEIKFMTIKHQLERDLSEVEIGNDIELLIQKGIPSLQFPSDVINGITHNQTIIVNNQQYIDKVEGIIAKEIHGNIDFSHQDKQLLKIVKEYAKDKTELIQLKSSLNELKDASIPKTAKTIARQKIEKFLSKVANKVGDVGIELLKKYLEQQMF